jgi:dUTP pyrophosphatase
MNIIFKKSLNVFPEHTPKKMTPGSSGFDLYASNSIYLISRGRALVNTGIAIKIPEGYEGQIRPRSSLSLKGIDVAFGTIDSDYIGELKVTVVNNTFDYYQIKVGDRIAQLVICPIVANIQFIEGELEKTERGENGWGSTGE